MYRNLAIVALATILTIAPGASRTASAAAGDVSQDGLWLNLGPGSASARAAGDPMDESHSFSLDLTSLESVIARAPMEGGRPPADAGTTLTIPMPDGSYRTFAIEESPIMEPELAASLPGVQTFRGVAVDDPTIQARFDRTQLGFHAMVLTPQGAVFVRPVSLGATEEYESYWSRRYEGLSFECGVADGEVAPGGSLVTAVTGETRYEYRLAVAATGEYTQFLGNAADALASIVTTVNQLNLIYEVEVAVRMILIADNADIVYDDAETDPFPLDDKNAEVQNVMETVIGNGNYDIGHLFHAEGSSISGNAGFIGCVCDDDRKGSAWSQGPDPTNGNYLFVVAHEMGHQFGATHTFNGSGCPGGAYTASSSWEPGSGTTIMSYSSICGADNVLGGQVGDLYFHVGSRDQITAYTQTGGGNDCATEVSTGNSAPTVNAGADWTIPQGTPFRLTATGSDPDGDALTYTWEQFDLDDDPAPLNQVDNELIPLFRSFPPSSDPIRTFPAYADLLAGPANLFPNKLGEQLPSTDRPLTFRTSARDGRAGGGGTADDQMIITVSGDPFSVTFPDGGETVGAGAPLDVTWTVGGGAVAPTVNILYATDGGTSWTTLASGVANDGSHQVALPCGTTGQGRIMIEAVGNIFFDISDLTFTVADLAPVIAVNATGGDVDDACEYLVDFDATVTDDGEVLADDVEVTVSLTTGNATLGTPAINKVQTNASTVTVTGSVLVSDLTGSPATVEVEVAAADNCGATAAEQAEADVADTTPPMVTCPADIVVECSTAGGVSATDSQLAPFFAAFMAEDNCDPDPAIVHDAPAFFAGPCDASGGVTLVTWTATDASGNAAQCSATVTVVDTTPPEITAEVTPQVLWPPNHKLVPVEYTVTVSDVCDDAVTWVLLDVVSNEPDNGLGDGDRPNDIQDAELGTPDTSIRLRSERSGLGDGRIYTATFEATDCSGNSAQATASVYVPHSPNMIGEIMAEDGEQNLVNGTASYLVDGASLWGREVPVARDGDQLLTIDPRSAIIGNTAGWVSPDDFFLEDVDEDQIPDALMSFDAGALADLVEASTEEDGDPVMVLDMGGGAFRVLPMTDLEVSDVDVTALIAGLRAAAASEELALNEASDADGDRERGDTADPAKANEPLVARQAELVGAAPNPFNPSTTISFYLPDSRRVELAIFDLRGRLVDRLLSGTVEAGEHAVQWRGTDASGARVSTGVYFYRLTAGSLVETKRMTLVK